MSVTDDLPPLLVGRFVKKPVEISAVQVPRLDEFESVGEYHAYMTSIADWCDGNFLPAFEELAFDDVVEIDTLEGVMTAQVGDWIIRGIEGEFYPCKPGIFEDSYEDVVVPVRDQQPLPAFS